MMTFRILLIFGIATNICLNSYAIDLPIYEHFDGIDQTGNTTLQTSDIWHSYTIPSLSSELTVISDADKSLDSYLSTNTARALKIVDTSNTASATFRTNSLRDGNGNVGTKRIHYAFSVLPEQTDAKLTFSGRSSSGEKIYFNLIFDDDGVIRWEDGGSTPIDLGDYEQGEYNHVELLIDIVSERLIASVNGVDKEVLTAIEPIDTAATVIDVLRISTDDSGQGTFYLDALDLKVIPPLPQSPLAAGSYYVDSETGSDANSGSEAAPWKSIWKVKNSVFTDGSEIIFSRGQKWLESFDVPYYVDINGLGLTIKASELVSGGTEEENARPKLGYMVPINNGYEILKNTTFDQAEDINIAGILSYDYIDQWLVDGVAHLESDGTQKNYIRLNAGGYIAQPILLGIGGAPLELNFEAKNTSSTSSATIEVQFLRKHPDGQIYYLKDNGTNWQATPTTYFYTTTLAASADWSTHNSTINTTNKDISGLPSAFQYELRINVSGANIGLDDISLKAGWNIATYTQTDDTVAQINIGSMSENLLAVDSSDNEMVMLRDGRIAFGADLSGVQDMHFSMNSYMLLVKDNEYDDNAEELSQTIYAPYLEYSTLVKGKDKVTLQSLDISGGRFGRSYQSNGLINFEDWQWYSRFKTAGGGLILINNTSVTIDDCLIHDNGGANITTVTYESGKAEDVQSKTVNIFNSKIYRAGSEGLRIQAEDINISNNEVFSNAHNAWSTDTNGIGAYSGSGALRAIIENNNVYDNGPAPGLHGNSITDVRDTAIAAYNVTNVTIQNNYVHDNNNGGIYSHGGTSGAISGTKILNNIVYNNGLGSLDSISRRGISIKLLKEPIVANNIIINNNVELDEGISAALNIDNNVIDADIYNNIIADNTNADTQVYVHHNATADLKNNIYWYGANALATLAQIGTTIFARADESIYAAHNMVDNPYFEDPSLRDVGNRLFSPQPWSAAYEGGTTVTHLSDAITQTRSLGLATDVGVYEQVIENASFESPNSLLEGWSRNWLSGLLFEELTGNDAAHGDRALKISVSTATTITLYQTFDLPVSNHVYTIRFWCKNPTGELGFYLTDKNDDIVYLTNVNTNNSSNYMHDFSCEGNGSTWSEQEVTFTADASIPLDDYKMVFYNYGKTAVEIHLDDVSVSLELPAILAHQ